MNNDNTLTEFPNFQPLTIKSKSAVEEIVGKFPPYSDFNFVSMYSWNLDNKMQISHLYDNLIVLFKDYTSDDQFLTFIGDNKIDETINTLLDYAKDHNLLNSLHLIPEHVIELIKQPANYAIKEDRDGHDYVVLAIKFSELKGSDYAAKRNGINKFKTQHGERITKKKLKIDQTVAKEMVETFHNWRNESDKSIAETENELLAVEKLVNDAHEFNLSVLGIYIDDTMVGYSIYELLPNNYAIGHFEKALKSHPGLYDYLKHSTALDLHEQGVTHINYEQDLGIENLRYSKMLLHPETFLKKYTITPVKK